MKHYSKILFGLLLLLTTDLFGQDYDMLTKNEWMSTSSGFQKHYLVTFSEGKIKSEFIQSDWSKYILGKGQIFIYNNDHVIYKKELDQIKEMGIQNATC